MPIQKKKPERKCVGCNTMLPKAELIRIVRSPEGEISLDFTGKKSGRGAYICRKTACLNKARKTGRAATALNVRIPESVYEAMERELNGNEE